jgi:carboxymethylenebutenolidase
MTLDIIPFDSLRSLRASALSSSLAGKDDDMENDELTRRDFVAMTVAAGLAAAAGTDLSAQNVVETNVDIKTPDGTCDAAFIHPATGAHPAVRRSRR